jgi:hypothetical protein
MIKRVLTSAAAQTHRGDGLPLTPGLLRERSARQRLSQLARLQVDLDGVQFQEFSDFRKNAGKMLHVSFENKTSSRRVKSSVNVKIVVSEPVLLSSQPSVDYLSPQDHDTSIAGA